MKVGVISDTHDRLDAIERAVEMFNEEQVDVVIHAGDFVSPFTERAFRALNAKFYGIFGNNDGDKILLKAKYREKGIGDIEDDPFEIEIQSMKIMVTHKPKIVDALASSGIYDIVIYGHTHVSEVRKISASGDKRGGEKRGSVESSEVEEKEVLVVNPGECCGYLTGRQTVAIIDLRRFSAEILEI